MVLRGYEVAKLPGDVVHPRHGADEEVGVAQVFDISIDDEIAHANAQFECILGTHRMGPFSSSWKEADRKTKTYYPGKEVGQAFQPDKVQSQAGKPDLHAFP